MMQTISGKLWINNIGRQTALHATKLALYIACCNQRERERERVVSLHLNYLEWPRTGTRGDSTNVDHALGAVMSSVTLATPCLLPMCCVFTPRRQLEHNSFTPEIPGVETNQIVFPAPNLSASLPRTTVVIAVQ